MSPVDQGWPRPPLHTPLFLALASLLTPAWAENLATQFEAPEVTVIATMPLPGIGLPLDRVPANVQAQGAAELREQGTLDLSEHLTQNFASVTSAAAQNNPYQNDVSFRGFLASPLYGAPQGISVFLDGVRINEAFGDTVNWDLLPPNAVANATLLPGSNPVFGLNTLGGAMSVQTKSGHRNPGTVAQVTTGSFGRNGFQLESGHADGERDFFIAANVGDEQGWGRHASSHVRQLFAKTGFEDERNDIDVSLLLADTALEGRQSLPQSMLDAPGQPYTWPDRTGNRLAALNLRASRFLADAALLSFGGYVRKLRSSNLSSNSNDAYVVGGPVGIANPQGSLDRSLTDTLSWGISAQYTNTSALDGHDNQFVVGASVDSGSTDFTQTTQPGDFTADRTVAVLGPAQSVTQARTANRYLGVYVSDTYSITSRLHLTGSSRWNQASVSIRDQSGTASALDGNHSYSKINNALGLNFNPLPNLTLYGSASQGMRVATPMELACADPAVPCKLPINFLADPDLKPVLSTNLEAGLRGKQGDVLNWSAALFRTDLHDDIQFISSGGAVNAGYFKNVGQTRRLGFESALDVNLDPWHWSGSYSYTRATYESAMTMHSQANSSADGAGDIQVTPGNRIPAIPAHSLRLRGEYETAAWRVGVSIVAVSSQYARGDDNNQDAHGKLPGYAVAHLDAGIKLSKDTELFGRVSNLFDRRYEGFAVLGINNFGPAGFNGSAEQFRSPAAPRGLFVGLRSSWK